MNALDDGLLCAELITLRAEMDYIKAILAHEHGPAFDLDDFVVSLDEHGALRFSIICSDTFMWGCADCEAVLPDDVPALQQAVSDAMAALPVTGFIWAGTLYCCRKRGMRPMNAYKVPEQLRGLFNACGPERVGEF